MWKLAVRYQAGTSEIIQANPQVSNPDLIYPGQVLNIPQISQSVLSYESEVIRLVNEVRRMALEFPEAVLHPSWDIPSPQVEDAP